MVISQFYPIIGGAEKQSLLLAQKLVEKGMGVQIVTGWWKWGTPQREIINGIPVIRNFTFWGMFGIKGLRTLGALIYMGSLGVYLLLNGRTYDLIHVHQVLFPAFVSVFIGKKFLRKNVIVKNSVSGLISDIKQLKKFPLGSLQLKYLIKKIDCIVTVSADAENEFKSIGYPESRIMYIPNGVSVPLKGKNNYDRVVQVLTVGRLDNQKGIDVLLKAWASVVDVEKGLKLLVLGSGPQKAELKKLTASLGVSHSVEFKGLVHNTEDYFSSADIFVLPSRAEGLSNALLEAMSYGTPCVATKVGGTTEVFGLNPETNIKRGGYAVARNGVAVNPDDVKGLSEGILYLVGNKGAREEIGKRARIFIKENYSIDLIAEKYIELYQNILKSKPFWIMKRH